MVKFQTGKKNTLQKPTEVDVDLNTIHPGKKFTIQGIRNLTDSTYVLRFDRNDMNFEPGQHVTICVQGETQAREYSIYSSVKDPFLEVLIKEVEDGWLSKRLHELSIGDIIEVDGPFGVFSINEQKLNKEYLFVATGTGISPFHCFVHSYTALNYKILHGIRYRNEMYDFEKYPAEKYFPCISRDVTEGFRGRVTDYLRKNKVMSDTLVYLCGNCEMIYEVYDILMEQEFPPVNIKTEVYF